MPTINVNIRETLTASTTAMAAELRGPGTVTAASRALAGELRDWFAELEQTRPNRMGWPRQHFWHAVRGSVQKPVVVNPEFAVVSITHRALRQRVEGGKILPGPGKKYLTIPANPEAYGQLAREFKDSTAFVRFGYAENRYGHLAPALIAADRTELSFGRKRKDGSRKIKGEHRTEEVFFWLVRQVYQPPDPTVLPGADRIAAAVARGAHEYATTLAARQNGGAA